MKTTFTVSLAWLLAASVCAEPLKDIAIRNDRAPDCSSLQSIVNTVTGGCRTDDEKVIALYNFCRYVNYHHAYPNEPGGISALKLINVYGWSLCGGQHTMMAALWEAAGYKWRYRGWSSPGHTTVEVFYGGRWHYLDTFLKFYAWKPDPQAPGGRTIASQEDIKATPGLVTDGIVFDPMRKVYYQAGNRFDYVGETVNWTAPAMLVCGDTPSGILSGVASSRDAGSPRGWAGIRFDDEAYSTAVNLAPGYSLTLNWSRIDDAFYFRGRDAGPRHTCGDKDYRNCPAIGPLLEPYRAPNPGRSWSNGTLVFKPDFRNDGFLASFHSTDNVTYEDRSLRPANDTAPGAVVIKMSSPYVVAKGSARVECADAGIEISKDAKKWTPVDSPDLTKAVIGLYRYYVRVTFRKPLTGMELASVVQHNQEALPHLAPGRNRITIDAANPGALGKNRLAVTYAYCPGRRDVTPEELFDRDAEIARAHNAHWVDEPVVVQKVIDTFPTTFEIVVPTPKGKQPVYPRMLFVRREVLAEGQTPAATPARPSVPEVGPNEVLATLPNPWLIGTQPPPKIPDRPTKTEVRLPAKISYVSKQGEVFRYQFVKWLKDDSNAWVLLADFDTSNLPPARSLARAKLVFYVHEAHDRAPMQVAAVALQAPFEPGAPYDFAGLGRTVGSTVIRSGNGPGAPFVPPRRSEMDVTGLVRRWSRGEKSSGLALRIVPNRSVDDGWTVRFTPDKEKPLELEIVTFTDR